MAAMVGLPGQGMTWGPADEPPTLLRTGSQLARDEHGDFGASCPELSLNPEVPDLNPDPLSPQGMPNGMSLEVPGAVDTPTSQQTPPTPVRPSSKHWAMDGAAVFNGVPQCNKDGIAKVCKHLLSGDISSGGMCNPYNVPELKSFLTSPVPESLGMVQCRVLREGKGMNAMFPKYMLELDSKVLVLTAQKQMHSTSCNYAFLLPDAVCPGAGHAERSLGKLNPDFCGLEFTAYSEGFNPKKVKSPTSSAGLREEMIVVQYNSSVWGPLSPGVRRMTVTIPRVTDGERYPCQPTDPKAEGLLALKAGDSSCLVDVYHSKEPDRDADGVASLDFAGRVTEASAKNFQLVSSKNSESVYVQFGRVSRGAFHLDFRFPFSPLQAFAACLSTFDFKLCCE